MDILKSETKEGRSQITELAVKGSSYEQKVKGLESERTTLEVLNTERQKQLAGLQTEKMELEKERAAYQQELAGLKEMKAKLEASVEDLKKRERELAQQTKAQQAAFDAKEKELRQMQKEESIRMEENKKEEINRLDKSYQNAMDKLSQQSNASFAGVLQSNTQLQQAQEVVMATLLAHHQQQSDFMRQALQSAQQAPSARYWQLNSIKKQKLRNAPKTTMENRNNYICIRSDSFTTSKHPTANLDSLQDLSAQYVSAQETRKTRPTQSNNYMHAISENKPLWILSLLLPMHTPSVQQLLQTVIREALCSEYAYASL